MAFAVGAGARAAAAGARARPGAAGGGRAARGAAPGRAAAPAAPMMAAAHPRLAAAVSSVDQPARARAGGPRRARVVAAAAATPAPAPEAAPPAPRGAKMKPLLLSVAVGAAVWFAPVPAELAATAMGIKAWKLLAVFLGTIVAIITQPLPLGAVALMGLGAAMTLKVMTFPQAFSAMASPIPWLIAIAFFFAKGFIKTGLGNRISYLFVRAFGKTTLGLCYSLVFAEALLAPAIPSLAARAGGIMKPLVESLSIACGSKPDNGTEKKMGAYLMATMFQTSCISSAMFLTAMAANPLAANLAEAATGQVISWVGWATAAFVPGVAALILIPLLVFTIYPPEIKESPNAPEQAKAELAKMGKMSGDEKIVAATLVLTVGLWIFGSQFGIGSVCAAIIGLSILMITGVVGWKECLAQGVAWDTLTWFAALIAMADHLNKFGLIGWFSGQVTNVVGGLGLAWQSTLLILIAIYVYSHYAFASVAAHIGAMYTAFLSVAVALGSPPLASALILAFVSNLMGCTTHYGIGSAPPYYGAGYVSLPEWWKIGFICSVANLVIFLGLGFPWWKFLGLMA